MGKVPCICMRQVLSGLCGMGIHTQQSALQRFLPHTYTHARPHRQWLATVTHQSPFSGSPHLRCCGPLPTSHSQPMYLTNTQRCLSLELYHCTHTHKDTHTHTTCQCAHFWTSRGQSRAVLPGAHIDRHTHMHHLYVCIRATLRKTRTVFPLRLKHLHVPARASAYSKGCALCVRACAWGVMCVVCAPHLGHTTSGMRRWHHKGDLWACPL